jgi:hypothetical protein
MRKIIVLSALAALALGTAAPVRSQEESAPALAGLVVRATEAGKVIDDLGLVDFDLSIAGRRAALQAVAFVRDNAVERQEGPTFVEPPDRRRIDLIFNVTHFSAGLEAALRDFMMNEFRPGDELTVRTPRATYTLSPYALEAKSREALARELAAAVRADIESVTQVYDDILSNLRQLLVTVGGRQAGAAIERWLTTAATSQATEAFDRQAQHYKLNLEKLLALRHPDNMMRERSGEAPAGTAWAGPKFSLLFYEHTFLPVLSDDVMASLLRVFRVRNLKLWGDLDAIDTAARSELGIDETRTKRFFGRDGETLFLFEIPAKVEEAGLGTMKPYGEELFSLLAGLAPATGGLVLAPGDPSVDLPRIMRLVGTYYILFYKPLPRPKDEGAGALAVSVGLKRRTGDLSYPRYEYTAGKG